LQLFLLIKSIYYCTQINANFTFANRNDYELQSLTKLFNQFFQVNHFLHTFDLLLPKNFRYNQEYKKFFLKLSVPNNISYYAQPFLCKLPTICVILCPKLVLENKKFSYNIPKINGTKKGKE